MLFGINEIGDLNIDKDNNSFSNIIYGEEVTTNINISRTRIFTYFKHKNWFRDNFVLYQRNNYEDSDIKTYIDEKINEVFKSYEYLKNYIGYAFNNLGDVLVINFYYKLSENENVSLLYQVIDI